MSRPKSIHVFEALFLGSLAMAALNAVMSLDTTTTISDINPVVRSASMALLISLLLLCYFIARRASNIAKWFLAGLIALGLLYMPGSLVRPSGLDFVLRLLVTLMQIAAVASLFTPDAKAWFTIGRGGADHNGDVEVPPRR